MIGRREMASIMGETPLCPNMFQHLGLARPVPKYRGACASGVRYAIVLKDDGAPVENRSGSFLEAASHLLLFWTCFVFRNLERAFPAAGIRRCDFRPADVLRASNGALRLIDFGYSGIAEPSAHPMGSG